MRDFTLDAYRALLECWQLERIPVYGVLRWVEEKPGRGVLVRHDVDRRPGNALAMARLEAAHGIKSTYYFRITRGVFRESIIRAVADLGHEVGYHYEDLALAGGDPRRATELFSQHLTRFRRIVPVRTIAMHGSPLSRHDNRTLWRTASLAAFDVRAEALLSIDYAGMFYLTDTGRTWAETRLNLRDRVPHSIAPDVRTTWDLIAFMRRNPGSRMAVVSHPERWDSSLGPWLRQVGKDATFNAIKAVLSGIRGVRIV